MAKTIEDVISGSKYLMEAQKHKLIDELESYGLLGFSTDYNGLCEFLYFMFGLSETDLGNDDRMRIEQFLADHT